MCPVAAGERPLVPVRRSAANVLVAHQQAYRCDRGGHPSHKFGRC
jgi:hypothetical protein